MNSSDLIPYPFPLTMSPLPQKGYVASWWSLGALSLDLR